jgi:nucleotide-binding universal stress UspA family protein
MEKIVLVLDGSRLDMVTVDFACYIARLTHSRLTALFIENIKGEARPALKQLYSLPYVETITAGDLPENEERLSCCEKSEKSFCDACINRGVNFNVHRNQKASVKDIVTESRFADLIIVNPATSFEDQNEGAPSHFVKEILADAECPVIIAPYSFNGLGEILFTYDGSRSSVFAIKQFIHFFSGLCDKKATVLQIDRNKSAPFKENERIAELLQSHCSQISFQHLRGNPEDELFDYLLPKKNTLVVMGSFGRGLLSTLFSPSTSDLVVKNINLPIFIAHY